VLFVAAPSALERMELSAKEDKLLLKTKRTKRKFKKSKGKKGKNHSE
jgi:hypothetical protein